MKTTRNFLITAMALAVAVFVGCSMNSNIKVRDAGDVDIGSRPLVTLQAEITNFEKYDNFTSVQNAPATSARTILPNDTPAYTGASATYKYYLLAKSSSGTVYEGNTGTRPAILVELESDGATPPTYSFKVSLPTAKWDLVLVAMPAASTDVPKFENYAANAALVAFSSVDLTSGAGATAFELTSKTLTHTGTLNPKLVWKDNGAGGTPWSLTDPTSYKVSVELQDLTTGKVLYTFPYGTVTTNDATKTSTDPEAVLPGTYNFVVKFQKLKSGSTTEYEDKGVWSDTIVIVPYRAITGNVYVPNILGKEPTDIDGLYATFVKDSENTPNNLGKYKVHFHWDAATVVNEQYFELDIAHISKVDAKANIFAAAGLQDEWGANVTSHTIYSIKSENTSEGQKEIFHDSKSPRVDGSLLANNENVTVWLELGKVYYARIRAVNAFGTSKWTEVTIDTPASGISGAPENTDKINIATTATASAKPYYSSTVLPDYFGYSEDGTTWTASEVISRYGITYYLQGGSYAKITTNAPVTYVAPKYPTMGDDPITGKKTVYYTIDKLASTRAVKLWEPFGPGGSGATAYTGELMRNSESFKSWKLRPQDAPSAAIYMTVAPTGGNIGVQPPSTADENDEYAKSRFKVSTSGDVGGYVGLGNLELYADYAGEFSGTVTVFQPEDYYLWCDWIQYDQGTGADDVIAENSESDSATLAVSKDDGTTLEFTITVPEDTLPSKYDRFELTITANDGFNSFKYKITQPSVSADGTATTVGTGIDISDWENMTYTAKFDAYVNNNNVTERRTAQVTIQLTD